ncbi:MAG: hypothetical protein V1835_02740 [Candidatus Micrarchaeota archaeon]
MPKKSPERIAEKKSGLIEFLEPDYGKAKQFGKICLAGIAIIIFSVVVLSRSGCPTCPPNYLLYFLIIISGTILITEKFYGILVIAIYYYLLACLILKFRENRPALKAIAVSIIIISILLTVTVTPVNNWSERQARGKCLTSIGNVAPCYTTDGEWNTDGCTTTGCLATKYGVEESCLAKTGPLEGTAWKKDETHFNCGPKPY